MNRIIVLITLLINLVSCNSQVNKKISNFDKLTKIDIQIKNYSTDEQTYKSLDSLKNVVDGVDAELYIETYKNAILYDTDNLLKFLKLNKKKVDEDVISFFKQDAKLYNQIKNKINTNLIDINLNSIIGKWKKNCKNNLESIFIIDDKATICVNTNQIYVEVKINKLKQNLYSLKLIKTKDLGNGGMELEWINFSKDSVISDIQLIDNSFLYFKWLGFYNLKSKNREWVEESDFSSESDKGMKLEKCIKAGTILDSDGYTNLRKDKNSSSEILQKINTGSEIEVLDNNGDWWLVQTKEGKKGYVYKSKIVSE